MAPTRDAEMALVVVNFRTPDLAARCVREAQRTRGELTLDVVVVDNGSGDRSDARLRELLPDVRVLALPDNRGFAAGVNAGVRSTDAPLIMLLNPDTVVHDGALTALARRLRDDPRVGVAAPLLENADGTLQRNGYRRAPNLLTHFVELSVPAGYALELAPALHPYSLAPDALLRGGRVAHAYGAALAVSRRAYEAAGPLDEGFFLYVEETEWQERVVRAGFDVVIVPQARVTHLVRGGGEESLAPTPDFVASAARYLRMRGHRQAVVAAVTRAALASSWLTCAAIALLPSKRAHARVQARAYRDLLLRARGHDLELIRPRRA